MSQTLTIPDDLYARLESTARRRGVTIEELLSAWPINDQDRDNSDVSEELRRRRVAVARIDATRAEFAARYGEMPDSTAMIREDRAR